MTDSISNYKDIILAHTHSSKFDVIDNYMVSTDIHYCFLQRNYGIIACKGKENSIHNFDIQIPEYMDNLNQLAKQALSTALSRGKNIDNFLEDLQSEVEELKNSTLAENENILEPILRPSNNITDEYFLKVYEKNFKNTTQDELMDVVIICFSKAESLGMDIHTWINAKMKYNSLRKN